MNLHIVYQDNHFLVVKKDFGVPQSKLEQDVRESLTKQNGKVGFLQSLNTLDALTSGLVVYMLSSRGVLQVFVCNSWQTRTSCRMF